ncbi:unnamed protein product [Cladocopium goreaui]|uniref:Outer membrane protein PmpB n=1 Tax=Cladocopium goreaui TaxID=2562237 RepID=A0A9P1GJW6_9DINO|nr:unnamed protein product [Cladocopium goreaui]
MAGEDRWPKPRKLVIAEDCAGLGPLVPCCKMVGLKPEPYYMSESDGPLRDRLKSLYKPELSADGHYDVQWKVMDAFGYAGLPQRRERLWIVGTNKYATRRKFHFPLPLPWAKKIKLSNFLGRKSKKIKFPKTDSGRKRLRDGLEFIHDQGFDTKECWVVDCAASKKFQGNPSYEVSPCLTRARGGGQSFWITSHGRYMNLQEKAAIQGWLPVEPGELTAAQLGAALGNAWPLPLAPAVAPEADGCSSFDIALEVGKKIKSLQVATCGASSEKDKKDIFDYIISELGSLERKDDQIRKLMAQMLMRNLANVEKATGSLVDSLGQGSATDTDATLYEETF